MLQYTLSIRDLVHGTVRFTEEEAMLIEHPFFQRLRLIRQNDGAFVVYPSMNTSRFEHALGVCHVAGLMAESLIESEKWPVYLEALKKETGIDSQRDFVKVCRFYALLHDIGHFPLSHLFEFAMEEWAGKDDEKIIEEWTGMRGFKKLHEAFGVKAAQKVMDDINLDPQFKGVLGRLMGEKVIKNHSLGLMKLVIDSDIDADRLDSVKRDGLLAGGEYGNYDLPRLCNLMFIEQWYGEWVIGYSKAALSSMEALLLDRYRTYTWIHFHHKVIAAKMLVRFLIGKALTAKAITKDHFSLENVKEFSLKDDVWLWNVLRSLDEKDPTTQLVKEAVFQREKANVLSVWKTRPYYHELHKKVDVEITDSNKGFEKNPDYHLFLREQLQLEVLAFDVPFKPIGSKKIYLYSESEKKLTGQTLVESSRLVADLDEIWDEEPQDFIIILGNGVQEKGRELRDKWVELSVRWLKK